MNRVLSEAHYFLRRVFFALLLPALSLWLGAVSVAPAAPGAQTRNVTLLVLPFGVNAPADVARRMEADLPALLGQRFSAAGFRVLSSAETRRAAGQKPIRDAAGARSSAKSARADYAVFGSFSQVGDSISLDMRLVDASSSAVRPYYVEKSSLLELPAALDELAAQAFAGATSKDSLADIQVRGLRVLDPDRVLTRLNTRKGDAVNVDAVDDDVRRVWDMGYFSDVSADIEESGQGRILVFTVVEKPRIDEVRVEGSDAVKIGDITEAMSSRTGTVLNERLLADDLQKITDLYRKKGYYLAELSYDVLTRPDGASASLILKVNEGNKLYIKAVDVEGLQQVRRKDLDGALALRKRSLLSWLTGTGVLKEDLLDRDAQAIQGYLVNQGYIDAKVSAPEVQYDEDGIRIIFRVREGSRYSLGHIGFRGDLIDTEERLFELIQLDDQKEKNTFFSLQIMQEDVKRLTDLYADYGYAFADVSVDTDPHPEEAVVDVYYQLIPREKVYVRRVELEGNTKTRDNVILRELRLADGQQFSGEKLRRSTERLDKLRYFDEVNPQLVPTGVPGEVDLKVGVKEGNTGMLSLGFGYSTYDKFGVSAGIRESNLFGRGYQLGLMGYFSGRENSLDLSFINPRLYNTDLGMGISLYAIDEEWTNFDKRTVGSQIRFSYPLGEYSYVNWGYRLDFYRLSNMTRWAAPSIRDYEGDNWASVLSMGVSRDTTNSGTNPTRGTKASLYVYYGGGGLGGSDNFVKPIAEWGFFHGLTETHVLHARATVGAVYRNTHKIVPAFERFYLGGMNSVRGYSLEDMSPRDPKTGEHIGSDRMGYTNFEYIWVFKPEAGLALVPFFDIGVSTDSKYQDFFDKVYYSAGLEVRWRSPMGDLRFAYGFPLTENVDGRKRSSGRFEFSMGQAF
ncbi:MAG: outer membrane protein assembly factor BamA [Desulfovibrionaceae bacterium]|nr:outer membrane protein assembly factor BamA [Desulfovibrionaceae bacterium]